MTAPTRAERALRTDVVALYVDAKGIYPKLLAEGYWYDEARDARTYAGPWPVVAHPPCGPWGRFAFRCKQDASCGPAGVAAVRAFGGVLEHPADSALWDYCDMSRPGEPIDSFGGTTYAVEQVAWGHPCRKPTWLYCVGCNPSAIPTGGTATHRVTNNTRGRKDLPRASAAVLRRTPPAFAEWLLELASRCRRP